MGSNSNDKAERLRKRVPFETSITIEYGGESVTYRQTYDISMNGVFVRTAKPLPVGLKGSFVITLSVGMRNDRIVGRCEVVRSVSIDDGLSEEDPGLGMGLKFIKLEPDSSIMLYQIIRYNQPV